MMLPTKSMGFVVVVVGAVLFFILTMLHYSLPAGHPDKLNKLQRAHNHEARLVLRKPRRVGAIFQLRTLHWLPEKARIV